MQPNKILFVIGSLDLGGAERHLALIAPRLKRLGWQPIIYCLSRRGVQSDEVERNGVTIIGPPWDSWGRQKLGIRFIKLFASCLKLLWLLIFARPRIAHFFLPLAYIVGAPLAWLAQVPILIMSRRSLNFYQEQHHLLAHLERILHQHMDAILCNSRAVFEQLVDTEGCERGKVSVIYNGIDIDSIDRARRADEVARRNASLVLIIVANLIPYKGHADLINGLAAVRDEMPEGWELLCVGRDDGIRSQLEGQVRRLNLTEHIRFLGERTDVESLLKSADIGILCSHQEGFANAILEGMAAGLPMVVTDVGGNSESVVHGETGLIVPPRNPKTLGAAIVKLALDDDGRKRMGLAGRRRAEENFSIDHCVAKYDSAYQSLVREKTTEKKHQQWRELLAAAQRSNFVRFSGLLFVTLLTLAIAFAFTDTSTILIAAKELSSKTVISVAALLMIGAILATVRFWCMASDIGFTLSLRDAMLAHSVGQVAGALTIQFFGQIAARSILLGPKALTAPVNIFLATYERLIAAMISAAFAITGAWYLFGRVALDLELGGVEFLRIMLGLVTATAAAATFGWGKELFTSVPAGSGRTILGPLIRAMLLTAMIQTCTMAAYVIAARSISPNIPFWSLAASAAVIAFVASLPISFAGWGVRELSAVVVLGLVGIQSGAALLISIIMGTLALVSLLVIAGVAMVMPKRRKVDAATSVAESATNIDVVGAVLRSIPLIAASAVFFQIHVPIGKALLNVNLADPVVILGCALFLIYFVFSGTNKWRLDWLNGHVIFATCVMVGAFLHGYYIFGWTDWAFNNKLLGWFVLLSYGATGALIVATHRTYLKLLLRSFIGTAVGIVLLELMLLLVDASFINLPPGLRTLPLDGFSQNRNAFAFILLLAVCGIFVMPPRSKRWLLGVLICGLWYAGSRAGWGALIIVLSIAAMHRIMEIRTIAWGAIIALTITVTITVLPYATHGLFATIWTEFPRRLFVWDILLSPSSSDVDRFTSIFGGINLFLSHPLFGSGLGAYIAGSKDAVPIIIHSTPIWILGEMGLVGFLAFAIPAARILLNEWRRVDKDIGGQLLILIMVEFAVFSSIHEMLYQRAMWLLLGAALAYVPRQFKTLTSKDGVALQSSELSEGHLKRL